MSVYLERFSPDKLKVKIILFDTAASVDEDKSIFVNFKVPSAMIKLFVSKFSFCCSSVTSVTVALAPTKLKGSEFKFVFPSVDTISKLPVRFFIGSVGFDGVGVGSGEVEAFLQLTANNYNTAIIITKIFKMFF